MTISSLPFLFLSVFFPRPCQLIINTEPGVETRSRDSRSSPFVWPESLCSQPRGPCPPCPGPNWNIWPVMSSQACYGLPTLSLSDISIMPQIVIVTLGREQTTHSSSPRSHNVNQDKLIALGIVSNIGHESLLLRVCLSRVQNCPTDLKRWSGEYRPIRNIMLLSGVNVGVKVCHSKMCTIKTS